MRSFRDTLSGEWLGWIRQRLPQDDLLVGIFGAFLLAMLTLAVLFLPPLPVLVLLLAVGVVGGIFSRPVEAMILAIGVRAIVDLTWWIEVGPLNAMQVYSGGVVLAAMALLMIRLRDIGSSAFFLPALLFSGLVALAVLRTRDVGGISSGLKLMGPWVLLLLLPTLLDSPRRVRHVLLTLTVCSVPAVLTSVYFAATAQRFSVVAHHSRLLGGYMAVTEHSCAMFVFTTLSVYWYFHTRGFWRLCSLVYGMGAFTGLYFSYTRAATVGLVVASIFFLVTTRRNRAVMLVLLGMVFILLESAVLSERFGSIVRDLTQDPGFRDTTQEVGSGRIWLWRTSFSEYVTGSLSTVMFGRGAGREISVAAGYRGPHQDLLEVMYQLGPLALVAWGAAASKLTASARRAFGAPDPETAELSRFLAALCLGCATVSMLTNGFLSRAALGWYFGAFMGCLVALERMSVGTRAPSGGDETGPVLTLAHSTEAAAAP